LSAPGHPRIAGFDEVGRGCLAGAVIAAAVILPDDGSSLPGLTDSKQLSPRRREEMAALIRKTAVAFGIGRAGPAEIDELNILQASLLAMQRAYDALDVVPELGLVDGKHCPLLPCASRAIVGGDLSVPAISAASILAKVYRDREMVIAEHLFPGYGFAIHKGYPTAAHRAALNRLGPSPLHRLSFKPVQASLQARPPHQTRERD
jgi:ribonuclease HII